MTWYTTGFAENARAAVEAQAVYIAVDQQPPVISARWFARVMAAVGSLQFMCDPFGVDQGQTALLGRDVRCLVFERTYLIF